MNLIGIVAANQDGCIGKDGKMPWHYKEDFQYFRRVTMDATVIMGRKTWDSLPKKPLDKRRNVIITNNPENYTNHTYPETYFTKFQNSHELISKLKEPHYVLGGEQIFNLFWPYIREFSVTHVNHPVENGDAFLPNKIWTEFKQINEFKLSDACLVKKYQRI